MGHKRTSAPRALARGNELTRALVGIGMGFAVAEPDAEANIEDALLGASAAGMDDDDLRVLSLLVTWLDVHHAWINADRLYRACREQSSVRIRAFWAAVGGWLGKDRRLARLTGLSRGRRVDLLRTGTAFQLERNGEDPRFAGTVLRVPRGVLRDRPADVLTPRELAARHGTYRERVHIGPSYRADMWAALERDPTLPAAELARRAYGSFATAWQVKRDLALLNPAPGG
jgi:hypothetical protein